ncbi:Gluconate 2-dehydrogenase subunit 3 [Flaviramulus basaltis]|uniref:Gluconate 2-dehydrogenase subunit 3 n=1 Tax=Flaviramulus basaltis TaxID=369401 RepID=A0A1K2IAQ5_9FLAO|nr:gluconate 2-dehydrogenase subunit 3 family protein [Flaviramulus basaltis]SFZ89473.1 Gluconate 2-dehydrogenase subunit 3 [Flaviramulus basaltis]
MKRRTVLKKMGLTAGFFATTPTVISLLQSCKSDIKTWTPEFLSIDEGTVLTNLVDIILPKTATPSATELNIPQFIDKYIKNVFDDDEQLEFKSAFANIISTLKPNKENRMDDIPQEAYKILLDKHMLVKEDIDEEREMDPESLKMTTSEFLNSIKTLCIKAYITNEGIGESVLAYDPIPGAYYCGDLQELTEGRSWSL